MENLITIYKIVNFDGKVEYVGQTKNLKQRLYQHFNYKGQGLFYKRTNVIIEIIEYANNRKEAYKIEEYWQTYYGLKTEKQKMWDTMKLNGIDPEKQKSKYKKRTENINADPEKKKLIQTKRIQTIDADPEKKKERYRKMAETRKANIYKRLHI